MNQYPPNPGLFNAKFVATKDQSLKVLYCLAMGYTARSESLMIKLVVKYVLCAECMSVWLCYLL